MLPLLLLLPVHSRASATPFLIRGLTAKSRNGPTRTASRFPKAPSATSSLLLLASIALVFTATTCRLLPLALMVPLPPRLETNTLRPQMVLPDTRTGSRLRSVCRLAIEQVLAVSVHRLPKALPACHLPHPLLPPALHLRRPSLLRRLMMLLPKAPRLLPTASRRSCEVSTRRQQNAIRQSQS